MKLRLATLALATAALAAAPAFAGDAPRRGKDGPRGERSEQRSHDGDRGDRFDRARREIRSRTVERGSERGLDRGHHDRRPAARGHTSYRHQTYRQRERDRHHDRGSKVVIDFRVGTGTYCPPPPPRRHVVSRTVVIEQPVVVERRRVVTHTRTSSVPTYVEYRRDAWDDLERGYHRAALDTFGILASSHRNDALPKIGYGLAAAGLHDDGVAATALRRALRVDGDAVRRFDASPRLDGVLRDLERRYENRVRLNPYDSDAVFLLAAVRTLRGDAITERMLENELQMLASDDRELLGVGVVSDEGVGMYDR